MPTHNSGTILLHKDGTLVLKHVGVVLNMKRVLGVIVI